jgi:hypothetical protein
MMTVLLLLVVVVVVVLRFSTYIDFCSTVYIRFTFP